MCVLQPCANPTQPGVWWRDDTRWCLYSLAHQRQIRNSIVQRLTQIDLGSITSTVHPSGARYTANLSTMVQVAVSSGQRRPIMVIDSPAPTGQLLNRPRPTLLLPPQGTPNTSSFLAQVHFRDRSGQLRQYNPVIAREILRAMVQGTEDTLLVRDASSGKDYLFDFQSMSQYIVDYFEGGQPVLSDDEPLSVVVEMPWNPTALASLAFNTDTSMRRKILVMVVERFRSDEHLDAILPAQAHPKTVISKSTYALSVPGHPAYEKFVDSLDAVFSRSDKGALGTFMKQMQTVGSATDGPLQMVFKPSEPASVSTRASSDTSGKAKAEFWTNMTAPVAAATAILHGCAVQLRILVFLVILPASQGHAHPKKNFVCAVPEPSCSRYVQVEKPEDRLQLAEVTVH